MEKQKKRSISKRRLTVKAMILMEVCIPLFVACFTIQTLANLTLKDLLAAKVLEGLKEVASSVAYMMEEIDSGEFTFDGNDLYKGNYNITQNIASLDKIANANDVELTVFYGDTRRATTITNASGQRILGTAAPSEVISTVIRGGQEYSASDVKINDEDYFGYYFPVKNAGGSVVGMIFAGKRCEDTLHYVRIREVVLTCIAIGFFCVFATSTFILVKRHIMAPINKISTVAQGMAIGDVDMDTSKSADNEFGDLLDEFGIMVKNIGAQARIAEMVADGDLTVPCVPNSEKDTLGKSLEKMLHENNKNLNTIRDASSRMVSGANEVASASNSLAQGTTEQASAIEEITASIEEIANGARINAEHANNANVLAQSTKDEAMRGNEQMKKMISAMKDINDSSENISKIMKVIDDIAFQTNILALNASVEAARAGVHGKGFAVVADEVRNLASKSAEAAKDSAEMIEDSIRKVEIGSKLAVETAAALEEILKSVEDIASIVSQIATASENQASSVGQVNSGITQIADVVQTNSATSQQCAAASSELSSLAGQLQHAVGKYKLLAMHGRQYEATDNYYEKDNNLYTNNEKIISLDGDFGKY